MLTASGIAKWFWGGGALPQFLGDFADGWVRTVLICVISVIEILLGVGMFLRRTRVVSLQLAFFLSAGFVVIVAASAGDREFIKHCSCLGGLADPVFGDSALGKLCRLWLIQLSIVAALRGQGARVMSGRGALVALMLLVVAVLYAHAEEVDLLEKYSSALSNRLLSSVGLADPGIVQLESSSGERAHLSDLLSARSVAVITFATGCPACHRQAPTWAHLAGMLKARGFETITVGFGDREHWNEMVSESRLDRVPCYFGTKQEDLLLFGAIGIPHIAYFVDGREVGKTANSSLVEALIATGANLDSEGRYLLIAGAVKQLSGGRVIEISPNGDAGGELSGALELGSRECRFVWANHREQNHVLIELLVVLSVDTEVPIIRCMIPVQYRDTPLGGESIGVLASFRGMPLDKAIRFADECTQIEDMRDTWRGVRQVLDRIKKSYE